MPKQGKNMLLSSAKIAHTLKEDGNRILKKHMKYYGQLRGFKKPVFILLQDELDGGKSRKLNAIETNQYDMPR